MLVSLFSKIAMQSKAYRDLTAHSISLEFKNQDLTRILHKMGYSENEDLKRQNSSLILQTMRQKAEINRLRDALTKYEGEYSNGNNTTEHQGLKAT